MAALFDSLQSLLINRLKNYVTNQLAYVYNYEKIVQELQDAVEKLQTEEKKVLEQAEEDEDRYGRDAHEDLKGWLDKVEKILSEYEEFKKVEEREYLRCFLSFPNLKARFDSGKTAEDIKEKVGELQRRKEGIVSSSNANNENCRQCHEARVKLISTEYITNQLANLCYHEKNVEAEEQEKVNENLRKEKDIMVCDTSQQAEYQDNESRCRGPSSIGDAAASSNANVEAEEKGKVDQNLQEETEIIECDILSHQEEDQDGREIDDGEVVSDNSEHKKASEKHEDRKCLGFAVVSSLSLEDIDSIMKLITGTINQLVYTLNPKKKVAELDNVAENLQKVRDMAGDTSQQDDGDKKWLDDVNEILFKVESFKKRNDLKWDWPFLVVHNPMARYRQGQKAEQIKLKVEGLKKEIPNNRSRRRGAVVIG